MLQTSKYMWEKGFVTAQVRWWHIVNLSTRGYNALSGRVGRRFIAMMTMHINRVHSRDFNAEFSIVFLGVILPMS